MWSLNRSAVGSADEIHGDAIQHEMPPYRSDTPSLTRTVTFNPAPDMTSGSKTATIDIETPLEQHLEHESYGQQCSSLAVLNLVRKDTFTHTRGTRIPGKFKELDIVDLPEPLHEKKEYSRSKTEKRRNSRENERKNLLERRDSQNMRSSGGKRYSLLASLAQLRMDLEKQILQEKSFQEQPLDSEIPHFSTFTDHHYATGTNRLFIKGASKDSSNPQRFMPVKTAFDMDDVQLFDYCQRNELLGNPEISSIFGNGCSQADSKRET
jgi:hypothetical protein